MCDFSSLVMSVYMRMRFIIYSFLLLQSHSAELIYFAELPKTVTAQTGSCVQIPCTFNLSDFTQKFEKTKHSYGIWYKGEPNEARWCLNCVTAFNSGNNKIGGSSEIQMIGNLTERNCTTVFYNVRKEQTGFYFFRLEMEPNVFKATFNTGENNPNPTVFKPVKINVTDSPARPKLLLIRGEQTVMEGSTVTVKCSAEALCPQQSPNISWSNVPESADFNPQRREIKPDQTQSVFSEMTFTASYVDHETNISCTVTYPRPTSTGSVEETMMLRVSYKSLLPVVLGCSGGALAVILFSAICILWKRKKTSSQTKQDQVYSSQTESKKSLKQLNGLNSCSQTGNKNAATFCQSDDVISSTDNKADELNYGEINFSVFQCEQRNAEREPEASVYSELQVHDRNKCSNNMENVYAEVKKK